MIGCQGAYKSTAGSHATVPFGRGQWARLVDGRLDLVVYPARLLTRFTAKVSWVTGLLVGEVCVEDDRQLGHSSANPNLPVPRSEERVSIAPID